MSSLNLVTSSPHIRSKMSTDKIMLFVILALLPGTLVGIVNFGVQSLINILVCIISAVFFEWLYQKMMKRPIRIKDLSAVLTGLLLGLNIPATLPYWMSVLGSFFAIIIVKQLFGGIGQNFVNPALAARAFLLISFTGQMTTWELDGISGATPLGILKEGGTLPKLMDTFIGHIGGSIGEVSAIALLVGGLFLIGLKVISYRIPLYYIGSVALMIILFGGHGLDLEFLGYHIFSGGLMIGAFFMATDYTTSPITAKGQIIMGIGCGILTALIRLFGGYPEGVSFAILIMNLFVPLIDRYTIPKAFGEVKAS